MAVLLSDPKVDWMVTSVFAATAVVVIVKVPVVAPCETVTNDTSGEATALLELARVTVVPPAGAAAERVMVPTGLVVPPLMLGGLRLSFFSVGPMTAVPNAPPPEHPDRQAAINSDKMTYRNISALCVKLSRCAAVMQC